MDNSECSNKWETLERFYRIEKLEITLWAPFYIAGESQEHGAGARSAARHGRAVPRPRALRQHRRRARRPPPLHTPATRHRIPRPSPDAGECRSTKHYLTTFFN